MPALSWSEIRDRAIAFAREWEGNGRERAEAQTFWNEFFDVFGIRRRAVASFEEPVRSLKATYQRIDLFWKGKLLAEHKSAGESLEKARSQAFDYVQQLQATGRGDEMPRYILLSDFRHIVLYDLEADNLIYSRIYFQLSEFHRHVQHFGFLIGQKVQHFGDQDPANLQAAQIMADLHDAVEAGGYSGAELERLLVRVLFCLFADDTGIFDPNQFALFIEDHSAESGKDLGVQLSALFDVLNTPVAKRSSYLAPDLAAFPYVNGELFAGHLPLAGFNQDMRNRLLAACRFDWSRISPAVFGSLFQGIMDAKERRQIGAHYTSERDILKVIRPLFLDALEQELERLLQDRSTRRTARLRAFHQKIAGLRFLDPACGCGNFLVIAYRELRRLEIRVLKVLHRFDQRGKELDLGELAKLSTIDVDQFYGIELNEWAVRIAETALWLTDHQMNIELSEAAGNLFQRIPLRSAPHIRCANALTFDWNELLPAKSCAYVLGNPPFVGAKFQTPAQRADVCRIARNLPSHGLLDYVTLWYFRASEYIRGTDIRCAFVSTNSIAQGEQVGILWSELFSRGVRIHFAHQPFAWESEAKGKAHVHVVIIGFGMQDVPDKRLYVYDDIRGEPAMVEVEAGNINPYLVDAPDVTVQNRSKPLCDVPEIGIGNKPIDGGAYLFTEEEKREFLLKEPQAERFFRPWIGADEFLYGYQRWCLWLGELSSEELRRLPECNKRVDRVKKYRLASKSELTRKLAGKPRRFHVENMPNKEFLAIPEVSSEKRTYIPIGFLPPTVLCSNLMKLIPDATEYHFGILCSLMHMAWVRGVGGRLKSDYRYSAKLIYNNFPWPQNPTPARKARVEKCAQRVLEVRKAWEDKNQILADLYDPVLWPSDLAVAHRRLDLAVDRCYRREPFAHDRARLEYLFTLYQELTAPLGPALNGPRA